MKLNDTLDDIKASIVVFLVALPLCLGIALASNAPLSSGIIAGVIGGIVIGFLSDSHISVSGPAAGLTVIVANGISQLGSFEVFTLAVIVAGLMQILFCLLRGGAIGDYFPTAVIRGMLAAIGLILIIKQFPNALGLKGPLALENIHPGIVLVSVVSLAIMMAWDKLALRGILFFKLVPGALIAVIVSILLNMAYQSAFPALVIGQEFLVQLPQKIFSEFRLPSMDLFTSNVFGVAFTIAVVASLETLLCIDASDKIDPFKRKTSKNRELLAQGVGNTLAGVMGGLPVTAVIVRTSANVTAGARTKLSAVFHGMWLIICVLLIPGLLNMIPLATLACVLLLVGYKLTKPSHFFEMKKRGWDQLFIFTTTIFAIVVTDLLKGIFFGLFVAILYELRRPALACLEVIEEEERVIIRFTKNVSFFHKARISKLLSDLPEGKLLHIQGMDMVRVHIDVHELLVEYHEEAKKRGMEIYFT